MRLTVPLSGLGNLTIYGESCVWVAKRTERLVSASPSAARDVSSSRWLCGACHHAGAASPQKRGFLLEYHTPCGRPVPGYVQVATILRVGT